jgi:uncharacterized protein
VTLFLPAFEAVPAVNLTLLFLLLFVAFFIKGAIGIGSLTPTVVFGALLIGPHHAVLLALIANVVSQVQFLGPAIREGDWRIARKVVAANFVGAAIGIWIFGRVGGAALGLILGLVLGAIVIADLTRLLERVTAERDLEQPATVFTLAGLSGLISGVTGAGGLLLLAIYLRMICRDKQTMRATVLLLSTLFVSWRAVVMTASGFVTPTLLLEGALVTPVLVVAGMLGTLFHRRISEARYVLLLQLVILMGALGLTWHAASTMIWG